MEKSYSSAKAVNCTTVNSILRAVAAEIHGIPNLNASSVMPYPNVGVALLCRIAYFAIKVLLRGCVNLVEPIDSFQFIQNVLYLCKAI